MTTSVATFSYTHSVTYVADNILKSLKDIIRLSDLDPSHLADSWQSKMLALRTWLDSRDLKAVILEIYNPKTEALILRWDIAIAYGAPAGDGCFWTDTEQLRYAIRKAGVAPGDASYDILMQTNPGRPDVAGWSKGSCRSTDGLVRHSLGTTIEHNGLNASAAYWRKV